MRDNPNLSPAASLETDASLHEAKSNGLLESDLKRASTWQLTFNVDSCEAAGLIFIGFRVMAIYMYL